MQPVKALSRDSVGAARLARAMVKSGQGAPRDTPDEDLADSELRRDLTL